MITHMTDHALIACRVTSEMKARVRALAMRQGITESTLVKRLLEVVLQASGLDDGRTLAPPDKLNRQARLYVRLEPQDWLLLKERSRARGLASATYASLLLRSHLRGGAPLPKAEYIALMQSIEGLAAVGRNLNQIARVLNQGGRAGLAGRQEVAAMVKIAGALRDHFKALLAANARSWEDGRAATSH
jgi:hypothetical protein